MVVPVDNVVNEIKENDVEVIVFKPYSKSDDYFSLFGMKGSVVKVARLVWVEELYNIFKGLNNLVTLKTPKKNPKSSFGCYREKSESTTLFTSRFLLSILYIFFKFVQWKSSHLIAYRWWD